jgi:hypothetical protein
MHRIEINGRRYTVNNQELQHIRARGIRVTFVIEGV